MGIYRTQWKKVSVPFNTISLGYDRQFYLLDENFSAGAYIINDKSGSRGLQTNRIYISLAYHKIIDNNKFHIGLQTGFIHKSFDKDGITLPDMWDPGVDGGDFDETLYNEGEKLGNGIMNIDFNLGAIWSRKITSKFEPEVGFAVQHFNYPKESFTDYNNRLPMRKVFHAGANYKWLPNIHIQPKLLYMGHKKASDMILGSNVAFLLPENPIKAKSIYAGAFFRSGYSRNIDAMFLVVGMNVKQFDVGISYDINVSELDAVTHGRGAFEISVIYTGASTLLNKITIPCDRY